MTPGDIHTFVTGLHRKDDNCGVCGAALADSDDAVRYSVELTSEAHSEGCVPTTSTAHLGFHQTCVSAAVVKGEKFAALFDHVAGDFLRMEPS